MANPLHMSQGGWRLRLCIPKKRRSFFIARRTGKEMSGYVDTQEKLQKILKGIQDALVVVKREDLIRWKTPHMSLPDDVHS
eukprot:406807-Hanusia_phi.AAC.2